MDIQKILFVIIAFFGILGALDKAIGNRMGLGKKFEEGIMTIGSLSISMIGMLVLTPIIADILAPVIIPTFRVLRADPAMFIGSIIANDMGGAMLAKELALNEDAANFAGLIVGSMLGPTVTFTIPTALGMIKKEDTEYFAMGVLVGIVTVPVGSFIGGLVAGFSIPMLAKNLLPVILFSLCIGLGLWKFQKIIIKVFLIFGKIISALIIIGLGVGVVHGLTGYEIIKGINPISESFEIVCNISIFLAGAFPLMAFMSKILHKPLLKVGKMFGMNEVAVMGMIATLVNSISMFDMIKEMDNRGKVVNIAFAVSAAFTFGDHLAFTASYNSKMIVPVIAGKLVGGISAIFIVLWIEARKARKERL